MESNDSDRLSMTFDKSVGMEIMEMLDAPVVCCYCNTPITPGTIGGFFGDPVKTICNRLYCLQRFADEEIPDAKYDMPFDENVFDSMRRGVMKDWGWRCPDYAEDCYCCKAHKLLDDMIELWRKHGENGHPESGDQTKGK
jgi:hypothetical protein